MKTQKGITLTSLIITILVLIIISSLAISQMYDGGMVQIADETKLSLDYKILKKDLGIYELKKENETLESLIGVAYKRVSVLDTKRELAAIVDFEEINSTTTYGLGGRRLLEEDNNDMTAVTEVDTIYELVDVYAIDLEDEQLYYINSNQIYTDDAEQVEVEEDGTVVKKHAVETPSQSYIQKFKFITEWNVTLGETEGSETYSTVVLPVNKSYSYDATIYWGDGTSTLLQHKINGITLTDSELIEKVTHNYTLAENDDGIRTIEISGTYTHFSVNNNKTTTKLKLTGIKQWGNTGLTVISFNGCLNLGGIIPKNDLAKLNCSSYCFNQTSISGLEEGFCFTGGDFNCAFRICYNLKTLPNSFIIPEGTHDLTSMFRECTSLERLPDNFNVPNSATKLYELFYKCSNLQEIPDSFEIPENAVSVTSLFAGCSNLSKIPEDFSLPSGTAEVVNLFNGCAKLEEIPDDFVLPDGVTSIQGLFGSSGIKRLPSNFKIPYGVTNMINAFNGCVIESFPENFEIPETVTNMNNAIRNCRYLKGTITIKANPSSYDSCFLATSGSSGGKLIVNYSKNCTNIDSILATGNSNYVVKGSQID